MRRIKMVLAAAALTVATMTAIAGPAMADDFTRCRDLNGDFVRCDGELFQQVDDGFAFNDFNNFFTPFFFDGFGFDSSCPFVGDFEGPVNQFDCFD